MSRRRLVPIRVRAAVLAALVAGLAFGAGALWQRHSLYQSRLSASVDEAGAFAQTIVASYVDGVPAGGYAVRAMSWAVTDDRGRVLESHGELEPYARTAVARLVPPPATAKGYGVVRIVYGDASGNGALDGTEVTLAAAGAYVQTVPAEAVGPRRAATAAGDPVRIPANLASRRRITAYALVSPAQARAAVAAVDRTLVVGVPAAALLVGCVAWVVTGRTLRRVEAIRAELADVTSHDLHRRVPVPRSRDEIHRLAVTTNATLDRLEDAASRQRRFAADAAHELRSPLAGLRNRLEVAVAYPDRDGWSDTATDLLRSTKRLQALTDDLLLLARMDGSAAPTEPVDVAALARELVAEREYLDLDGPPVTLAAPAGPVLVPGDEQQLGRMLRNLLDNATRHADAEVAVEVGASGSAVAIEVADDGPGIAAVDRERVFDRFTRLDGARSRDRGGAGLGLAIVADVAARHGGEVGIVDSERGARFVVRLPAGDDPDRPRPPSAGYGRAPRERASKTESGRQTEHGVNPERRAVDSASRTAVRTPRAGQPVR